MSDAYDCVDAFMHWARGGSLEASPKVSCDSMLLPNAVYVPGWNHLWSNLVESCCESVEDWTSKLPKLRRLTKFLRIKDYRLTWARSCRGVGNNEAADALEAAFNANFLHWRWETIAEVLSDAARL
eukprot:11228986-Heterocapsa_arctica.AAC.1